MATNKSGSKAALALAAIVAISTLVSAAWLFGTPLFAEPDEQTHLDYALTIVHEGWPMRVGARRAATDVDALLKYFERAVHYRNIRYDTSARADADYGSRAWRSRTDLGAPPDQVPRDKGSFPFVARIYPAGFYLIGAAIYRMSRAAGLGAFESISIVRSLGTFLLPVTLLLAFAVFRRANFGVPQSLLATAVIGLLPLTSWVSASFQPDTLTTTLVTAALLSAMVAREKGGTANHVIFGVVCGSIAFAKVHYAIIAFSGLMPAIASGAIRRPNRQAFISLTIAASLPLMLVAISIASIPHAFEKNVSQAVAETHIADFHAWSQQLKGVFLTGYAHDSFWIRRDWPDSLFFAPGVVQNVRLLTLFASMFAIAIVLISVGFRLKRICAVATRHPRLAIAIVLADAPLTLYTIWTAALIGLDLSLGDRIGLLGRYWLPVMVPLIAIVMRYASFRAPVRARSKVATAVAVIWLAYAVCTAPVAYAQVTTRFFGATHGRLAIDQYIIVESLYDSKTGERFSNTTLTIKRGHSICARGVAIDSRSGLPARGVLLRIDRDDFPLRVQIARVGPENVFNDDLLRNVGFFGCVSTSRLSEGSHAARFAVVSNDHAPLLWPPVLNVNVAPR